jgi:formate hydrogenlyase transcriptional activator
METTSDARFDPDFARDLLIELSQERSVEGVLAKLTNGIVSRPPVARVEIWLIESGDSSCLPGPDSSDPSRCLHLVASAQKPASGQEVLQKVEPAARIPLGAGIIGRIAETGRLIVLQNLDHDAGELSHLEWLPREQIRGFAGSVIAFKGEILGVIAIFTRINVPEETHAWRQLLAANVGAAIANARAFEEIQFLKAQLELQNSYLQEEIVEAKAFGDLIGQSPALRHIVSQIDLVAPTEASVLILGATGTGKELVAHEIHRRSRRKDKPLIRVNCASIPKDLYESEFFGHVRGAFTGAVKDRAGRFEAAEGGTLFLDEIGEVPLDLQSRLLRVLQEKRYERVGEERTRFADVRIIGATNRDLKKEMAAGRFREDLYYRLNVFPIQVPDLKERVEDIPLLAKHFIELSVKQLGCPRPRLTHAGVVKLQHSAWPGNIRELRNVIERAVIVARGGVLDFDLPAAEITPGRTRPVDSTKSDDEPNVLTQSELKQRERENLLAVLQKTNWKIKGANGAAELLGVNPSTLITRMHKMGLRRPA